MLLGEGTVLQRGGGFWRNKEAWSPRFSREIEMS